MIIDAVLKEKEAGAYSVVGKRLPLLDAGEKVSGRAQYTGDMELPGMLYAKILRSPYAHARVMRVDTSAAERLPGVKAVLSRKNAPRVKVPVSQYGPRDKVIFDDKVRYVGDEVAAVAAVSVEVAEKALKLIEVDYEELAAVFDPEEAMKPGAPLVHDDKERNSAGSIEMGSGDVEVGFQEADYVFEETFRTSAQRHACVETHCAIASFDSDGKLTVWAPTQAPFLLQELLAEYLDLPMSKVRVVKPYFGGGFGSKLDMLVEHICALLSRMTGRPVRSVFTREEEFTATVSRHADIIRLKVGVRKDGTLSAIEADLISNEGAYMYKPGPSGLAGRGLTRTYRCPNTKYEGHRVYTNLMSGGAFRGYGNLQAHFAVETMMDIVAEKLGIDPVEFRLRNYKRQGDTNFADLPIKTSGLAECLAEGKEKIGWEKRGKPGGSPGIKKRGIGMACCMHGSGPSFTQPDYSAASIRINPDGTAHLSIGTADLGTGSTTTLVQVAAEELGIGVEAIDVTHGDTSSTSFDSGIFASRTLYTAGNAVRAAAADVKEKIMQRAAAKLGADPNDFEFKEGRIYLKENPEKGIAYTDLIREASRGKKGDVVFMGAASFENSAHPPSFGAHFAEVEVDTETGQAEVLRIVAYQDNGKAINPMVVEGQIEGALAQSIGFALTEDPVIDKLTGEMLNPDFASYMVLTALDMPRIELGLVETYEPTGPFGAKGMSELPISGTTPAIANAIYNAVGVRLFEVPMMPERIFRAVKGHHRDSLT